MLGRVREVRRSLSQTPAGVDGRGELREPPPNVHLETLGAWRYAVAIVDELVAAGWVDADLVDITDRVMP